LYNIELKEHYDKNQIINLIKTRPNDSKKYLLEIEQKFNYIKDKKQKYLQTVRQKLDDVVYGQELIKEQINMLVGQWLSGSNEHGCAIGICGPPGTGKTDIIKNGISKCLVDKGGNTRPFIFISLGGSKDSAELKGHGYTYQHSQWGKLVQAIMDAKCMNPIIFFDEIDKVSESTGRDIINFLVHVTDQTQNMEMSDRYFDGIKFDYSGFLIFCTYNDPTVLGKVLRDRFTELHVEALTIEQKVAIIQNFTIKKLCKKIGINVIEMDEKIIRYIITNYTREAGIRKLIEKVSEILKYINIQEINDVEYVLNEDLVDKILDRFNKPIPSHIISQPTIGVVNGLYATNVGDGGITPIQAERTIGKDILGLKLSGKLGETMKESAECAKTLAWKMLTEEERNEVIKEYTDKPDANIHIHCPDAAMPKDGPSAGITLTTVLYSFLTKKPVNNEVAMTGEVDLLGNVKAIGGLKQKINGAILAGCTKVVIPKENEQDYDRLTKILGDKISIVMAETIDQVINHAIVINK
jgi:ATP-dependent Lon protease